MDTVCPSATLLLELARGEQSDAAAQTRKHVEGCTSCRTALAEISAAKPAAYPSLGKFGETFPSTPPDPSSIGQDSLDFLSDPQSPDELGWLAGYRVLKVLGTGGMGMVLLAEDNHLQRLVALKVIKPEYAQDADMRQRFLREARAMAQVKNDHVVTVYQVGVANDTCFIAMELLDGEPLDDRLEKGNLPLREAVRIGREIAEALAAAHARGLIHRDVKPANVWLESPTQRVKLLDFGLARPETADARLTSTGAILGTPAYMPPEQARGEVVDHRADVFSLGCVLYEMITGKIPFRGETPFAILIALATETPVAPIEHNPDIPRALNDLIVQMLAKQREDRPGSAQEVISQLRAVEGTAAAPAANPLASIASPTSLVPQKVLLVEPSRTQASIIRKYLEKQVPYIVTVGSGQEAMQSVRANPPQAIVTTLHLADMTGIHLAQQIRDELQSAAPGFVVISSEAEASAAGSLSKCGKALLLHKPFTSEQLIDALKFVAGTTAVSTREAANLHVLIVDDSTPARLHMRRVLKELGLTHLEEATDGAQAVAAVARDRFDLIVSDYNMPFMDGKSLVGFLKQNPTTSNVPVIMVTSEEDPAKLDAVRQLGVAAVCNKSFPPNVVRKVIDQLVKAP